MTKEDVIGWLEFLSEREHIKADGIVPCDTEIALGMAIKALKQPEIVRCKECKYAEPSLLPSKHPWCSIHEFYREPDWFCADGKPKGGDGE